MRGHVVLLAALERGNPREEGISRFIKREKEFQKSKQKRKEKLGGGGVK